MSVLTLLRRNQISANYSSCGRLLGIQLKPSRAAACCKGATATTNSCTERNL